MRVYKIIIYGVFIFGVTALGWYFTFESKTINTEPIVGVVESCKQNKIKTLYEKLETCNLSSKEMSQFKTEEVAKLIPSLPKTKRNGRFIEIVRTESFTQTTETGTHYGIQVFARVWDGENNKIGFGDGTVEIQDFRFFYSMGDLPTKRLLVEDPNGKIIRNYPTPDGSIKTIKLREDPAEYLLQQLDRAIDVAAKHNASKIVQGKEGHTVDTYYPANGAVAPVDGNFFENTTTGDFATVRAAAGDGNDETSAIAQWVDLRATASADQYNVLFRSIHGFDTSPITSSGTVASSTMGVFMANDTEFNTLGQSLCIDTNPPADSANLANADFNLAGWSGSKQSDTCHNLTTVIATYLDSSAAVTWNLNATGIASINKTGYSWYGGRLSDDVNNGTPTWASSARSNVVGYFTEQDAGKDPYLIVDYTISAASAPANPASAPIIIDF